MRPLEGQLRVCELEAYKAVYCGLCRQLGQSFGLPARFTLSYDASFLALLGLALAEENCDVISLRERDESLESYYVSLIGGQKND